MVRYDDLSPMEHIWEAQQQHPETQKTSGPVATHLLDYIVGWHPIASTKTVFDLPPAVTVTTKIPINLHFLLGRVDFSHFQ